MAEEHLASDLLSESTRKYRSSIIAVASALLAVQTFHVRITELPVAGIKIELVDQLIPVALTLSLVYLTISFGVCLADDIINFEGATFVTMRMKKSVEEIKSGNDLFAKYIFDLLRRYLQSEDAKYIADELGPILFVVDPSPEDVIAERATDLLKRHKSSMVLADTTFDELIRNVRRSFRAARHDARRPSDSIDWSLRAYYYFRSFRVYALEAAFPLVLATAAFAARMSNTVTETLQRLLTAV